MLTCVCYAEADEHSEMLKASQCLFPTLMIDREFLEGNISKIPLRRAAQPSFFLLQQGKSIGRLDAGSDLPDPKSSDAAGLADRGISYKHLVRSPFYSCCCVS